MSQIAENHLRALSNPNTLIRRWLAFASVLSLVAAIYGSILPLRFQPVSWSDVVAAFYSIPWFELGVTKRADWFANGLLILPIGFFITGAVHYGRSNLILSAIGLGIFSICLACLICFIEAIQVFFPPRVRSLNDMAAGFSGGLLGNLLWHLIGSILVRELLRFREIPKGIPKFYRLSCIAMCFIALSSLLPLDLILSFEEFGNKLASDRVTAIPYADLDGLRSVLHLLIKSSWALPIALIWTLQLGKKAALKRLLVWSVGIELITFPIFSRYTSTSDILTPIVLGVMTIHLSNPLKKWIVASDKPFVWGIATVAISLTLFLCFNAKFDSITLNPQTIENRLHCFFSVPYASTQRSTEFQAIENISGKLALFAIFGFFVQSWSMRKTGLSVTRFNTPASWIPITFISILGMTTEVTQIFLLPLIPEVGDVLTYLIGGAIGIAASKELLPDRVPAKSGIET